MRIHEIIIESTEIPEFYSDIPNQHWLDDAIEYAKKKGLDSHGVPYGYKVTGFYRNHFPVLPVALLSRLHGMRSEQSNVREDDLEWLKKELSENGLKNTGVPFINVFYDGSVWVNEGNHRIMAAKSLGWKSMPVEIRYFDGGELISDGQLSPENVKRMAKRLQ